MTDEYIINQIITSFSKYNIRDIEEINKYELDFTIAEFILCSCLIDQMSGFRYNTKRVGKRYRQFVKDYLPRYNSDELYEDLRNKLVHNYSVGNFYSLTRKASHIHLQKVNNVTYLNLEDFISDLKKAITKYFGELQHDDDIRKNALCWFSHYRIIGLASQI